MATHHVRNSLVITAALALIASFASGLFWLRTTYQHAVGNRAAVASLLKCEAGDLPKLLPGDSQAYEVMWQNYHGYGYIRFTATAP